MEIDKKFIKKIAKTWRESHYGHSKKCQEKTLELSELLAELYDKVIGEKNE